MVSLATTLERVLLPPDPVFAERPRLGAEKWTRRSCPVGRRGSWGSLQWEPGGSGAGVRVLP